mgnify:CR=1 FL=1|jgi:hypothetical protein
MNWRAFGRKTVRHPLFVMWAIVVFSLIVKESYPLSHFPMYSNIEPKSHYFYLANGNGEPLKGKRYFGIAMSNMKKKYHSFLTPLAEVRSDEAGKRIKASELGEADQEQCGQNLIDYLLPRGEARGSWKRDKPDVLRLVRIDIKREGTVLKETKRVIAERSIAK